VDRAAYPSLDLDTTSAVSTRSQITLGQLLESTEGLLAGWLGACAFGSITVAERLIHVPHLYERPRDMLTHAAAEIAAGACVWTLVWLGLKGIRAGFKAMALEPRLAGRVAMALSIVFGAAAGIGVCDLVVRRSAPWFWMPPYAWWSLAAVSGITGVLVLRAALRLAPRRRTVAVALCLLVMIALPHVWALDRYVRNYGRLVGLIQIVISVLAATGVRLLAGRRAAERWFRWPASLSVAASLLWLAVATPTYSSRSAVLVLGGVGKHLTLGVLWPLFDRDGDGVPSVFWGTDPDDGNRGVTPVPHATRPPASTPALASPSGERRELLFVVVDTARRDSFERLVATDARVRRAFERFAYHARHESCSTRTDQVISQLLGAARCDPRPLPGGPSLLEALRRAGYVDRALRYYSIPTAIQQDRVIRDERTLLAEAHRALAEPPGKPRLLFVHLRGGHDKYEGPGETARERYEGQLARAFVGVSELVEAAPPERYAVVVLGDHGEAFGEHLSPVHATTLYQEVLDTPFLIRSPASGAGRRLEPTSCADVAWEVLRALELWTEPVPALGYQYAMLDILPGQFGRAQRDSLRSLRIGPLKAIQSLQTGILELYDLDRDPGETKSLASSHPELLAPLRAELHRLQSVCPTPLTAGELPE
jgi:hypothetical protein